MKLYYAPGACALSPQIALRESGLKFELVKVDLRAKTTEHGEDFLKINPKGQVPALVTDEGFLLTEGAAIVQYVADKAKEGTLAPKNGTAARYQLQELLNFVASEIHKGFSPLFNPVVPAEYKTIATANLNKKYAWLDEKLAKQDYLLGDAFSVADGYLYNVTRWSKPLGIDLSQYKHVNALMQRVQQRPTVQAALLAEGIGAF